MDNKYYNYFEYHHNINKKEIFNIGMFSSSLSKQKYKNNNLILTNKDKDTDQ